MATGFEKIGKESELQDYWLRRLVAFIIDSIIISISTMVIAVVFSIPFIMMTWAIGYPWNRFDVFSFPFFAGIFSVLYFALFETYYGSTLGKNIMNLKTTRLEGQKPTLGQAFMKNASKIYWIAILVDVVVGLASSGDPHQKITDRIAGTVVVSKGASPFVGLIQAKSPVRFCSSCDGELPKDAKYCPHCRKEQE